MQSRHGSYEDVDISKLDLTVSTVGEQRLGLVKSGATSFYIYRYRKIIVTLYSRGVKYKVLHTQPSHLKF